MRVQTNGENVTVWLSADDTYQWAHKAGAVWPGSTLSGHRVRAEYMHGDLVDFALDGRDGDCDGSELDAIICDLVPAIHR